MISVRVQPRAKADAVVEVRDGVLVVRVTAPPLDGRANEAPPGRYVMLSM